MDSEFKISRHKINILSNHGILNVTEIADKVALTEI